MEVGINLIFCVAFGFRMFTKRSQIIRPSGVFHLSFSIHCFDHLGSERIFSSGSDAWNQSLPHTKMGSTTDFENLG